MRFEVEVVSEELLPAVRSMIADQLKQEYGLKQSEIAEKLEVTQPAVSQYLSNSRANQKIIERLEEDPQIGMLIRDAASKAARDKAFAEEVSEIIKNVRDKGIMKEEFRNTYRVF
ncbi:MAG: transcriptional regulator [Candidatus Nanohaloarchaea archaeon]